MPAHRHVGETLRGRQAERRIRGLRATHGLVGRGWREGITGRSGAL